MKNKLLIDARYEKGWNQQQLADFANVSRSTIERAERGESIRVDNIHRLCACLQKTPEQLGLLKKDDQEVLWQREVELPHPAKLWADDLLASYAKGIAACRDLYFNGQSQHVEAILPLYSSQTEALAKQRSPLQRQAAYLASQAQQLTCELATDREDFGTAGQAGRQAFLYAQFASERSLQVSALISLANLGFHRKLSLAALEAYKHAISLFDENVTPLLKGRTYAGIAEVYAMRGQLQESMRAMGLAYEHYPLKPEEDSAYSYLRSSRYALYVFGDAQSRLFLKQPKEADKALVAVEKESNDPQIEPITQLDLLYYKAEIQIQQGELEASCSILSKAATLARELGSRLYFNKLAVDYHTLLTKWPQESLVTTLDEVFQPW